MRAAHLLRKYNPMEWGGTETAVQRLLDGLRTQDVESVVFCPRLPAPAPSDNDPFRASGHSVRRFKFSVPVWRISPEQRRQLIAVGGNLLSFDLLWLLLKEKELSLIHAHTGNRLGGAAATAARLRKVPLVITIHGGVLDLPDSAREMLRKPLAGGVEWGKLFGLFLRSRRVLEDADAILTCNGKEAGLLRRQYPRKRILVQPHGVPKHLFARDHRAAARAAFPNACGRDVLLCPGRLDPVKNQLWLVREMAPLLQRHPNALLVLAGSCSSAAYGESIETEIQSRGLRDRVLLAGGLPPADPRLIGLMQEARAVVLPSLSETFGLVILEAWASGTAVIVSRTSGALDLVRHRENGWLFDPASPETLHCAIEEALASPRHCRDFADAGRCLVDTQFDSTVLAARVKRLYEELIEEKPGK